MYYRYEFELNNNIGILIGLDDIFDEDKALELSLYFDLNLSRPTESLEGTISYFTEKGNRKFNKAIKRIKKAALEKNVNVIRIESDGSNLDILYEDEYQILAIR